MNFAIYIPPQASSGKKVPVLYWLSGLYEIVLLALRCCILIFCIYFYTENIYLYNTVYNTVDSSCSVNYRHIARMQNLGGGSTVFWGGGQLFT